MVPLDYLCPDHLCCDTPMIELQIARSAFSGIINFMIFHDSPLWNSYVVPPGRTNKVSLSDYHQQPQVHMQWLFLYCSEHKMATFLFQCIWYNPPSDLHLSCLPIPYNTEFMISVRLLYLSVWKPASNIHTWTQINARQNQI